LTSFEDLEIWLGKRPRAGLPWRIHLITSIA
jgi:hypothetical protein